MSFVLRSPMAHYRPQLVVAIGYRIVDGTQMPIRKVQYCSESVTQQQPVSSLQFHLQTSNKRHSYSPCIVRKHAKPLLSRYPTTTPVLNTCCENVEEPSP